MAKKEEKKPKQSEFQKALSKVNTELKLGDLLRTGDEAYDSDVTDFLKTGIPPLDIMLGGGLPVGRVCEIVGEKASGKSTIAIQTLANCQKQGGLAVLIDTENSFHRQRAQHLGIDTDGKWVYLQPNTLEATIATIVNLIKKVDEQVAPFDVPYALIVWDTIAFTPLEEQYEAIIKGEEAKAVMGRKAVKLRDMMANLIQLLKNSKRVCMLAVNHTTVNMDPYSGKKYSVPGGSAFGFGASVQLHVRASGAVRINEKKDSMVIGHFLTVKIEKSRMALPKGVIEKLPFYFINGVVESEATLHYLKETDLLPREGNTFKFPDNPEYNFSSGPAGVVTFKELWKDDAFRALMIDYIKKDYQKNIPWEIK